MIRLALILNLAIASSVTCYYFKTKSNLAELTTQYDTIDESFKTLDSSYFKALQLATGQVQNSLRGSILTTLPDSIVSALMEQKRLGMYFIDYKRNMEYQQDLVRMGLSRELRTIEIISFISLITLAINCLIQINIIVKEKKGHR